MGDLTELQSAQAVEITDTTGSNAAKINTALPGSSDPGLTVREVAQGQTTMANSRPVVIASNQTAIPVTISTSTPSTPAGEPPFTRDFKLFDYSFLGQDNLLLWYQSVTGGGTGVINAATNAIAMTCTTASGDQVIRQSQRVMGQSGVSMIWQATSVMGAIKANVRQRVGAFDSNDGYFFEQNGMTLRVVARSSVSGSPVDTAIAQASWNIDKLDGTGASGITLTTANQNTYFVTHNTNYSKFGIIVNGNAYFCHEIFGANVLTVPNILTINLPIRTEITNTGTTASATTLSMRAAAAFASGGTVPFGVNRAVDLGITGKSIHATLTPLISLRLRSSGVRNVLIPQNFTLVLSSSQAVIFQVIFNGTLTGASFAGTPGTNTISEYDTAATAISGGNIIYSGYSSGSGNSGTPIAGDSTDVTNLLKISSNIAGTSDVITWAAQKTGGTSPTAFLSILYRELF